MTKNHQIGYHSGAVQYGVKADLDNDRTSNGSMCSCSGTILTFIQESDYDLKSRKEILADYQFNKKDLHHQCMLPRGQRY